MRRCAARISRRARRAPFFVPIQGCCCLATRAAIRGERAAADSRQDVRVWKEIVDAHRKDDSKIAKEVAKDASHWNNPEQVIGGNVRAVARECRRITRCRFS